MATVCEEMSQEKMRKQLMTGSLNAKLTSSIQEWLCPLHQKNFDSLLDWEIGMEVDKQKVFTFGNPNMYQSFADGMKYSNYFVSVNCQQKEFVICYGV